MVTVANIEDEVLGKKKQPDDIIILTLLKEDPVQGRFRRSAIVGAHTSTIEGKENITIVYLMNGIILEVKESPEYILR